MSRSEPTVEELSAALPELEELELLRLALADIAIPDPGREWDSSSAYATIDKRIVHFSRLEEAVDEAEQSLHANISALFAGLRRLFRSLSTGDSAEAARQLVAVGEQQEQSGLYRKARQCYRVALSLSLPLPEKQPQILALRRIARVAFSLGEFQEAQSYYQRSAELARDSGDLHSEIIARTGLGNVRLWQGRSGEAEGFYRSALALVESVPDGNQVLLERAQLYNNLGNVATRQMKLEEAERWFELALELWKVVPSVLDLAVCFHNMAHLRTAQGGRAEAREIYKSALDLQIPSGLWVGIAIDLAESYLRDGHVTQADELGRAAEERAISARSPYYLGRMYHGRGNIARVKGDDGGFIFFEKALQIAREKGYPLLEAEALLDYARLRVRTGGDEEARAYLERAREIFIEIGASHEQARVDEVLGEIEGDQELSAATG